MMMSALTLLGKPFYIDYCLDKLLIVFLLPPDSGEKIALGITVLLAFSVFGKFLHTTPINCISCIGVLVLAIAEKMPETSDSMPLIGACLP
jgi:nicotinic acetylcholine receptor